MFEEPYRWMEAVSTRHNYVQEKLKMGQPVLSVPFDDGVLIMGFAPQPGKVFEIYDRIALGGVGHPADVERLRMTLLDMAHLEGFNRSAQDVTLARLLQFGIAPALKQNFEEIQRAPYIVRLLLVELNMQGKPNFFRIMLTCLIILIRFSRTTILGTTIRFKIRCIYKVLGATMLSLKITRLRTISACLEGVFTWI